MSLVSNLSVLKNGSKKDILEILRQYIINSKCGTVGDNAYHLVLKNEELTEDEIIEISLILRKGGINPNTTEAGKTPLHLAIENRMKTVVNFFIKCDLKVNKPFNTFIGSFVQNEHKKFCNHYGRHIKSESPSSEKIETDSIRFLEWLISKKTHFDRKDDNEYKLLESAFRSNVQHILPVLLKYASSTSVAGPKGLSLLCLLFEENDFERRVRKRRKNIESINWYSNYTLRYTAEIVKILLKRKAFEKIPINPVASQIYSNASEANREKMKKPKEFLIKLAIMREEDIDIIKMLVDYNPSYGNVSSFATSSLHALMKYSCSDLSELKIECYLQILRDLVAKGANIDIVNELKMRPLQTAVKAKNLTAVTLLNDLGSDFGILTKDAKNLMHLLSSKQSNNDAQQDAIFYLIVGKGCKINVKDENNTSPLHLAAGCGNEALVRKLINQGADVNCKDKNMRSPLDLALMNFVTSHAPLIRELIQHGADVDCRDENMRSPLHYAVMSCGTVELVELLLENGANVNAKDDKGDRPLSLMASNSISTAIDVVAMTKVLLKRGAQMNSPNIKDDETTENFFHNMTVDIVEQMLTYGLEINWPFEHCYGYCGDWYELMKNHWLKLIAASLSLSEDNLKYFHKRNYYGRLYCITIGSHKIYLKSDSLFYEKCLKEVETLKATLIDTHTSLYHLLHMDINSRCIHINNDKLKNLVHSPTRDEKFPLYSYLVVGSYRQAVVRKQLLEPAKKAWLELTEISLPDICIERILSFLSNINLMDIIDTD